MPPPDQALWFAEIVRPHEPALRAFLSRRFSSLPDHDDLVQETYARLLRLSDPERLVHARAFLFTTARNVAIDHVRRTQRTPVDSIDDTRLPCLSRRWVRPRRSTAPSGTRRCSRRSARCRSVAAK